MNTVKKLNVFCKEWLAIAKGDSVEAEMYKAWRMAESQLKVEIARLEGDTIKMEDEVEDAEDNMAKARANYGKKFTSSDDKQAYVTNLYNARNKTVKAKKDLKDHNDKLQFLKEQLQELAAEVEDFMNK